MMKEIARIQALETQLAFIRRAIKDKSYMGCGLTIDLCIGVPDDHEFQYSRNLNGVQFGQMEDTILQAMEQPLTASLAQACKYLAADYQKPARF
jgi:hypothetical protein